MLGTKEHYDAMENFEKNFSHMRLDKEKIELWSKGQVYQSGETNNYFSAFLLGYSFARVVYMD